MVELTVKSAFTDAYYESQRVRPRATADTSVQSLPVMELQMSLKEKGIYDCLCVHGPLTLLSLSSLTGWPINTLCQPLMNLRKRGLVVAGGVVTNPTGAPARSWITAERAKINGGSL
jgi:hypothetical protein